jgi:hypothetical protein
MAAEFPSELTGIPLEDIDPYYQNKKVSLHCKKGYCFSLPHPGYHKPNSPWPENYYIIPSQGEFGR